MDLKMYWNKKNCYNQPLTPLYIQSILLQRETLESRFLYKKLQQPSYNTVLSQVLMQYKYIYIYTYKSDVSEFYRILEFLKKSILFFIIFLYQYFISIKRICIFYHIFILFNPVKTTYNLSIYQFSIYHILHLLIAI